jgi:PhzF family phenazine biosynthesis protein
MKYKIYQIDAFAEKVFSGNPAAVCLLDEWLDDDVLQKIAMENNLSETAFFVKRGNFYEIRWFTPTMEVDLCGHATLASAYVLFHHENHKQNCIHFYSPKSGELTVTKQNELLTLNFPTDNYKNIPISEPLTAGFEQQPVEALKGKTDYVLVFEREEQIKNMKINLSAISKLDKQGVIITAKGDEVDFVSRYFGPQCGIDEDPVTGSAHTTLTPYWAKKLNKIELVAVQLSKRKGYLQCKHLGDRVEISGQGKLYLIGEIYLD